MTDAGHNVRAIGPSLGLVALLAALLMVPRPGQGSVVVDHAAGGLSSPTEQVSVGDGGAGTPSASDQPVQPTDGATVPDDEPSAGPTQSDVASGPGATTGDDPVAPTNGAVPPPVVAPDPDAGDGSNGGRTYNGVSETEILAGFAYQVEGCGGYDAGVVLEGLGINNDLGEQFRRAVELFNEHPVEALELTPEQASALTPGEGYWGRTVTPLVYDDKGVGCEEAGRAMAVQATEEDDIFAMVQDGSFGTESWVSEEVTARERLHIGKADASERYFSDRNGYAWDGRWPQGDKSAVATASWVCRDLAGQPATDTGDPLVAGQPRSFGMLRFDDPDSEYIAEQVKAELAKCGVELVVESAQTLDPAVGAQQTQSAMARMRREGVTSIFVAVDWTTMTAVTQSASKQGYYPEWLISSYFQHDQLARVYYFYDGNHKNNVMGTTHFHSEHEPFQDETYEFRMWQLAYPDRDQPETNWREVLYQTRTLFRGIYGAGPNLTPQTWAQGLASFCDPCHRSDPLLPLQILRPGHHAAYADFGIIRWDPDRTDPTEIDSTIGDYRTGWWEFLDGGQRYLGNATTPSNSVG